MPHAQSAVSRKKSPARTKSAKGKKHSSRSSYRIEHFTGEDEKPYWRLLSEGNNETLAVSESYSSTQARSKTTAPLAEALRCEIVVIRKPKSTPSAPVMGDAGTSSVASNDSDPSPAFGTVRD